MSPKRHTGSTAYLLRTPGFHPAIAVVYKSTAIQFCVVGVLLANAPNACCLLSLTYRKPDKKNILILRGFSVAPVGYKPVLLSTGGIQFRA